MTENLKEFKNAYSGLKNNFPSALPSPFMSLGAKAQALSNRGVALPTHLIASAPIVRLSPETDGHFHRFAGKLSKALYYRTMVRPVPNDVRIITHWTTADQPGAFDFLNTIIGIMPTMDFGSRINTDLGDQFYYRSNISSEHNVIAFTASFSSRVYFSAIRAPKSFGIDFDKFLTLPSWREVAG